jgi:hypothetical protein
MIPLGLVQRGLRPVDGQLQAFSLLLPGGLFPRPFLIPALLLPFVGKSSFPLGRLVDGAGGRFFRFAASRLANGFRRSPGAA